MVRTRGLRKTAEQNRFNIKMRILHAIGHRTYAQKMTFKNGKTTMMRGIKRKDGEATFEEIKTFLVKVVGSPQLSDRTLRGYIYDLIKEGFVQSTGARWGKKAIYTLTKKGKILQWEFDRANGYLQAFLQGKFKDSPLIMGHTRNPEGKEIMDTYMVLSDPEEVELLLKAGRFAVSKVGDEWAFFRECARVQKLGLLWYCRMLVDPRFSVFKEKYSFEKLLKKEISLNDLFKGILEFAEESKML